MKQFITLSILLLYLNSSTELHELMRFPVLLEHYAELREKSADLSFWEYLLMHYQRDVLHDDHDAKLPFKNPAHAFVAPSLTLCAQRIMVREIPALGEVQHSSAYTETDITSPLSEIFQPPRLG